MNLKKNLSVETIPMIDIGKPGVLQNYHTPSVPKCLEDLAIWKDSASVERIFLIHMLLLTRSSSSDVEKAEEDYIQAITKYAENPKRNMDSFGHAFTKMILLHHPLFDSWRSFKIKMDEIRERFFWNY